jgi:glutamate--cysteine ligase
VRYVEMRSLDLDVFDPIGISEATARFIEALLLACLLKDSPPITERDHDINNANQLVVANTGRKLGLQLQQGDKTLLLQDWAHEILDAMLPVCAVLDQDLVDKPYAAALTFQRQRVDNPDMIASAQILANMREAKQPFARFGVQQSAGHAQFFKQRTLDDATTQQFDDLAVQSHAKQQDIESKDSVPFDEFLTQYFAQH